MVAIDEGADVEMAALKARIHVMLCFKKVREMSDSFIQV